jgi:hypothetical protein
MIEDISDIIYAEVKDGIVVNLLLGSTGNPLEADNLFLTKYIVRKGWKQISEEIFIPPTMTEEEWNTLSVSTKAAINSTKEYYDSLVTSAHYINNIPAEKKEEIQRFIQEFARLHKKINEHDGWILNYLELQIYYKEPFRVRPNLEIEA